VVFDDGDPLLARLRSVCLSLPGSAEKISHGRPNFFTKKVFAVYGGVVKGDHHSGRYDQSLLLLPDPDEAVALAADPRFFTPAYYGPYGWLGLDLTAARLDWTEVRELVEDSFRQTAPKTLVRALANVVPPGAGS
jgi:hypothetical protein